MGNGHWIKDEEGFHHFTNEEYKRAKEAIEAIEAEEFAQKVLTTGAIGALLVVGTIVAAIVAAIVGVGFLLFSIFDYVMQYLYKH